MFKTGVDEWLRLCQLFTVLVLKHCSDVDLDVDQKQLPPLVPTAKGKAAAVKGKGAAVKGNVTAAKGTAAAGDGGPVGAGAKKDLPAVEGIIALRLRDCAERGKSGSETWHVYQTCGARLHMLTEQARCRKERKGYTFQRQLQQQAW